MARIYVPNSQSDTVDGSQSSEDYTVQLRAIYRRQGIALIKAHPLVGVGLGNYLTGDAGQGTLTNDPHDVLILDAGIINGKVLDELSLLREIALR